PVGYERAFTINLNPLNGSSVLGPAGAAAGPPAPDRAAPAAWRTDSAELVTSDAAPPPAGGAIVSIEPLPEMPATSAVAPALPASAALRPAPARVPPTPVTPLPLALLDRLFHAAAFPLGAPRPWLATPAGKNPPGRAGLP